MESSATAMTVYEFDDATLIEERLALLEKDFDRNPEVVTQPADSNAETADTIPAPAPAECETVSIPRPAAVPVIVAEPEVIPVPFMMPPTEYMHKGIRHDLIVEGVCVDCARCGMDLTDAVSVERGLGPDCSRKGYLEDPQSSDEMQAFIDLAEYPDLAAYLAAKYKPLGVRSLMNGLVKIASLNRRSPGLHSAICDAIDSLGYKTLAGALRDSIATVEVKVSSTDSECYQVWVKKSEWSYAWSNELKRICGINQYQRMRTGSGKGVLVPMKHRSALWTAVLKHFSGHIAKTPKGTVKINQSMVNEASKED